MQNKLARGVHEFRKTYFATNRPLFERLANGQRPETLFITCSDSRLVPNLLTSAAPGELFIVRNVGNVVPSRALPGGTAAAIEYAVCVLGVRYVVVCGHTHCGAIEAVLDPDRMKDLPYVKRWLEETTRVRNIVDERYADLRGDARVRAAVAENVLVQLENLRSFPFVAERLASGALQMIGWVFDIETGEVVEYSPEEEAFLPLLPPST